MRNQWTNYSQIKKQEDIQLITLLTDRETDRQPFHGLYHDNVGKQASERLNQSGF